MLTDQSKNILLNNVKAILCQKRQDKVHLDRDFVAKVPQESDAQLTTKWPLNPMRRLLAPVHSSGMQLVEVDQATEAESHRCSVL